MRSFASRIAQIDNEWLKRKEAAQSPGYGKGKPVSGLEWSFGGIKPLPAISISPLSQPAIQHKLAVNEPGDRYEQEADRVAEQIMRMPEPSRAATTAAVDHGPAKVQRKCDTCAEEEKKLQRKCAKCEEEEKLQRKEAGAAAPGIAPASVHETLHSSGAPLDSATRAYFEPRFGRDLSHVRIHNDGKASESARAVSALAYTVGSQIVFDRGQYAPQSQAGRRLLAHELVHVMQQRQWQPRVQRTATPDDETKKKDAVKHHVEQQQNVTKLLGEARTKLTPDPSRGLQDPDNLYRNSIEMLDRGHVKMLVLTPTHDSKTRKPGQIAYFDSRVKHPNEGGDYPADPAVQSADGMVYEDAGVAGSMFTVHHQVPGYLSLYTDEFPLSSDELRQTFVHEVQHYADLHPSRLTDPGLSELQQHIESYKTEFRAYWVQPGPTPPPPPPPPSPGSLDLKIPPARVFRLGGRLMDEFPSDQVKPTYQQDVKVADPASCNVCPAPAPQSKKGAATAATPSATGSVKTAFKNQRQQAIFEHVVKNYTTQKFDCYYVCSTEFRKEVNDYAAPAGLNLINSARLYDLYFAVLKLKTSMSGSDSELRSFADALMKLEPLDWLYLKDTTKSAPLWTAIEGHAPAFVRDNLKQILSRTTTPDTLTILGIIDDHPRLLKDREKRP